MLRSLVVQTGTLDPTPLDGIVALGGLVYTEPKAFTPSQIFAIVDTKLTQRSLVEKRGIYTGFVYSVSSLLSAESNRILIFASL